MRRSRSGHWWGLLPFIVLLAATVSCLSVAGAPTATPSPSPTSNLPPAVQTADALNAMIATYVASIATSAPGWTATAEVAVKGTLAPLAGGKPTSAGAADSATPTPPPAAGDTATSTLPPAVQTADALNSMMATFIASIPTSGAGTSQAPTLAPALQTAQAQFQAVKTLGASLGSLAGASPTPTPGPGGGSTGGAVVGGGGSGSSGGGSGGSGSSGGGNAGGGNGSGSGDNGNNAGGGSGGPFVVKQIETLGGEAISGVVCNLSAPFVVNAQTPKVAFAFVFAPRDASHGGVSYKYSIPSAGESHDAAGTYSISPAGTDGALQVSLAVSDHVVFKGFDGNIPNRYKFNLVPTGSSPCP